MALTNKLTAIGDAIRQKTGKTDLLTLDEMVTEIGSIEGGGEGGYEPPAEAFSVTGDCQYRFYGGQHDWFINDFGDRVITNDLINTASMFQNCESLEEVPFDINFKPEYGSTVNDMFSGCMKLKSLPNINNLYIYSSKAMFKNCRDIREIPESFSTWGVPNSSTTGTFQEMFYSCFSLRKIPSGFLKKLHDKKTSWSGVFGYSGLYGCHSLDEVVGVPVPMVAFTSSAYRNTFDYCSRAKEIIFDTNEDGSPKVVTWKNQNITLLTFIGFVSNKNHILTYNNGITADKYVGDDATYQALKNDPDWYTDLAAYSRYNHDSAVNTINSLPDTSSGSGNTITFRGNLGEKTDGGAINTLTEEEIAVATARGWTVSFS